MISVRICRSGSVSNNCLKLRPTVLAASSGRYKEVIDMIYHRFYPIDVTVPNSDGKNSDYYACMNQSNIIVMEFGCKTLSLYFFRKFRTHCHICSTAIAVAGCVAVDGGWRQRRSLRRSAGRYNATNEESCGGGRLSLSWH